MPVDAKEIRRVTRTDPVLSKVLLYTMTEWPVKVEENLKPYFIRKNEISVDSGLLFWGYRVIIPRKCKLDILAEIHATHMGSSKMKTLARQYFWWPSLDKELEDLSRSCDICRRLADNPNKAQLIKFNICKNRLERVHIDFLGPFYNKVYLIITDSYSKWPEVYAMNKCDSSSTIDKLRDYCARFGLPKVLVSDNGAQFTSEEFQKFINLNGIKHSRTAPAHPSTNGAAENAVRSFKNGLKKMLLDEKNDKLSKETIINRYLMFYRSTPHSTTGQSPAKLMLGRELRTRFDLLRDITTEERMNR